MDKDVISLDSLGSCAAKACSLIAMRLCDRCHRPFCNLHARWIRNDFVIGRWAAFEFVCYECMRGTSDDDAEEYG